MNNKCRTEMKVNLSPKDACCDTEHSEMAYNPDAVKRLVGVSINMQMYRIGFKLLIIMKYS